MLPWRWGGWAFELAAGQAQVVLAQYFFAADQYTALFAEWQTAVSIVVINTPLRLAGELADGFTAAQFVVGDRGFAGDRQYCRTGQEIFRAIHVSTSDLVSVFRYQITAHGAELQTGRIPDASFFASGFCYFFRFSFSQFWRLDTIALRTTSTPHL